MAGSMSAKGTHCLQRGLLVAVYTVYVSPSPPYPPFLTSPIPRRCFFIETLRRQGPSPFLGAGYTARCALGGRKPQWVLQLDTTWDALMVVVGCASSR